MLELTEREIELSLFTFFFINNFINNENALGSHRYLEILMKVSLLIFVSRMLKNFVFLVSINFLHSETRSEELADC